MKLTGLKMLDTEREDVPLYTVYIKLTSTNIQEESGREDMTTEVIGVESSEQPKSIDELCKSITDWDLQDGDIVSIKIIEE